MTLMHRKSFNTINFLNNDQLFHLTSSSHRAYDTAVIDAANDEDDDSMELEEADSYHYVSYIYKNGFLWELDGLKIRPLKLANCTEETWLDAVKPVLEAKMHQT